LFVVRNLNPTTSKIEKLLRGSAVFLKQIGAKAIEHVPSFTFPLDEMTILENLQMMRNCHEFDLKKLRNVTDCHFTIPENIDDPESNWISKGFQLAGTKF